MRTHGCFLLPLACLVLACGGDDGGPSSTGTISGTVTSAASGAALAGAIVSVGSVQATSDASGRFELTGVLTGAGTIECSRAGFVAYSAVITVQAGSNSRDIALATQEIYQSDDFSFYVPAGVAEVRAVIVALGGPDTRTFVDGRSAGSVHPETNAALKALGQQLKALARDSGIAVLGSGRSQWANEGSNDGVILGVLQAAAAASGHPELSSAPLIMFGISAGGPGAFGMMQRQAGRTAAFTLSHPSGMSTFLSVAAHGVPGFIKLAELDDVVDNATTTEQFLTNRAAGAIWGLAVEHDVSHEILTDEARMVMVNWMATVAGLRLPASPGGALRSVDESSGWLGNRTTYEIAPYASYGGDPLEASWLLTAATAAEWKELVTP
jgi:hypothetical protein